MRIAAALLSLLIFATGILPAGEMAPATGSEELAKLQAMDLFPDLEDETSDLHCAVEAEIEQMEREHSDVLKRPGWPVLVVRRVAARLGLKPRTVAEIRTSLAVSFDVEPDEIQRVHGIRIVEAKFKVGPTSFDVLPQIASRVSAQGIVVDCDRSFISMIGDESKFERRVGEKAAEYWKRQRDMLGAAAAPAAGDMGLSVVFELHSERKSAAVREGERLSISEEGQVTVSKIPPVAGFARPANLQTTPGNGSGKKARPVLPADAAGRETTKESGRRQPSR